MAQETCRLSWAFFILLLLFPAPVDTIVRKSMTRWWIRPCWQDVFDKRRLLGPFFLFPHRAALCVSRRIVCVKKTVSKISKKRLKKTYLRPKPIFLSSPRTVQYVSCRIVYNKKQLVEWTKKKYKKNLPTASFFPYPYRTMSFLQDARQLLGRDDRRWSSEPQEHLE